MRRALGLWLLLGAPLLACGDTVVHTSTCGAPSAGPDQVFGGTLTTTVSGQSLDEPRDMVVRPAANGVARLDFGSPSHGESDCLIVAAGGVISDGYCADLTDPSGSSLVQIVRGSLVTSSGKADVDFDTTIVNPKRQTVPVHFHFAGVLRPPSPPRVPSQPPELRMTFGEPDALLDAPFPNQTRVKGGTIDLKGFPEPVSAGRWYDLLGKAKFAVLRNIIHILEDMAHRRGFSVASGIFFQSSGPLDPVAADIHSTIGDRFVLAPVVPGPPDHPWRLDPPHPIKAQFREHGGSLAPANTLALVPLQGRPLRENTLYVAFVRKGLGSPSGALAAAPDMARLVTLTDPPPLGIPQDYVPAMSALKDAGVKLDDIAGMTVFRTGAPTAELRELFARTAPPAAFDGPFKFRRADDDFCVYETTVKMPVYQGGTPPYQIGDGVLTALVEALLGVTFQNVTGGGDIAPGAAARAGAPSRVVLTVPRTKKMPPAGWPIGVFVRAGAGLDATGSPLVDRGPTLAPGKMVDGCLPPQGSETASQSNQTCGAGPGREFARAGLAGITVDGPQTGSRLRAGNGELGSLVDACKVDPKYGEDNAMFDVCNPRAITDNIRQSALEVALVPALLDRKVDVVGDTTCHLGSVTFDSSRIALMGHSMGATIVPLALHLQPRFRAVVLSGANSSYIENIMSKEMPTPLAPQLEQMLGLDSCLDEFSLLSSLFQWAEESSDPIVYEPALFADVKKRPPPDVLMIQGIGDHYIPPPVANVNSMGLRLDLLGVELDKKRPQLCTSDPEGSVPQCGGKARYPVTEVLPLLAYVGTGGVPTYPPGGVTRNRDGGTRGLVQYNRDAACREDGHEVAYEIAQARWQYRCFLASFARGQARVWPAPPAGPTDDTLEIDAECPSP
ncbi:MAG TPA: hypothetical protein VIF09_18580 [Polyangiaceae bacterium]